MPTADIRGQKFGKLTALEPTEQRNARGYVMWRCRCDCGTELRLSYGELRYSGRCSCGCSRKSHREKLHTYQTHVGGTSLDILKSEKVFKNNTSGHRGVYLVGKKYAARITFQNKIWHLGTFDTLDGALEARKSAEKLLFDSTADFYRKWKARQQAAPRWAAQNPVRITVAMDEHRQLQVTYAPEIPEPETENLAEAAP